MERANASLIAARTAIFSPSQRPGKSGWSEWIETPYGKVRKSGRLGQRHQDLLEAMLYHNLARARTKDKRVHLLVDPHDIRMALGSHYSHEQIQVLIKELTEAVVEVKAGEFHAMGHLVDTVVWSDKHLLANPIARERGRKLWRVTLGAVGSALVTDDILLTRDPAPIAALDHGIAQAVARWCLSHKDQPKGGWRIDCVLNALCVPHGKPARDARYRLRASAEGLARLGLTIENDRITKTTQKSQE
ncbi:MAG: ABC transporter ATPase [Azospira oryzae]|nr:MAG: ABC transporter ATPase [Azospira oryzae]PZP81610.1 MAG: ABC transporter ATPase [Azospira oryzae]